MIRSSSLSFCAATNRTTSRNLSEALADLRDQLHLGVVDHGESVAQLTRRVEDVFDGAATWRARSIARSETSRAVHAAQERAAIESGVVAGFEWLISANSCPLCQMQAAECRRVPIGRAFAEIGDNPAYRSVRFPPLHVSCRCSVIEVLAPEYGGPADPQWGQTLIDPRPGRDYTPPAGAAVPEPDPGAAAALEQAIADHVPMPEARPDALPEAPPEAPPAETPYPEPPFERPKAAKKKPKAALYRLP
jgi:hypothetical protein